MEAKRQKIDPVQFILDLNPAEFHREILWRREDDLKSKVFKKLEELQDLVYSNKPWPQSTLAFDKLVIRAPNKAEFEVIDTNGDSYCRFGERWTDDSDDEQLESFLNKGHTFQSVVLKNSNQSIEGVLDMMMEKYDRPIPSW